MKILQINAVNKIGSTGRNVSEFCDYATKNGHICINAYSAGIAVNPETEYIIGSRLDAKIHGLCSRVFGLQGYFSKRATRKLIGFVEGFSPDVVLLHNLHGNYINLKLLLAYLSQKDICTAVVLHDCWVFTGKCCHYTVDGCYKWQSKCGNCPSLKKYNRSWIFDRTCKMLNDKIKLFAAMKKLGVIGVSKWITSEAQKSLVLKNAKKFVTIYNWVDVDMFKPLVVDELRQSMGFADKKIILCVAKDWNNTKGLDTVLKLSAKLNDDEVILLIGNVGSDVEVNSKICHIKATDTVADLVKYYSMADVFLQPSLEETFGKVSAEALACGTPVVCFESTANPELVGEGCGEIVKDCSVESILRALKNILSHEKTHYTESCRQFAVKNFDKDKNLEKYIRFFEELVQ